MRAPNRQMENGYTKFNCQLIKTEACIFNEMNLVNIWRDKLHALGLIGVYENGVGYGNISIRVNCAHSDVTTSRFIITGTATGSLNTLNEHHFTKVLSFSLEDNSLTCIGPIKASSESLTHAAIYQSDLTVNAVIHVHDPNLWVQLMNKIPTTSSHIEYGTPEMAKEVIRLFKDTRIAAQKIMVMGGHEAGIISFGSNLEEAGSIILERVHG
jgi:L-ribulose-5-phosphate 4-epimerase